MPHAPRTLSVPAPLLLLTRAEGVHVWDSAGRRYLDATSGAFCAQLGYSRPDLVEAMSEAASRVPHARPSISDSEHARAYRRRLLAAAGAPYKRAVLTSSGSEAVDVALKIAHRYQVACGNPERTRVAYLAGHYHGATLGALSVTGYSTRRAPYEAAVGPGRGGPSAFCARCFRGLSYPSCRVACADAAVGTEPPAAFILETIPGAGLGVVVPPPGYLARVRTLCDGSGALWIADEVLTGFGRTGALFSWQRLAEQSPDAKAEPDLVVFGKGAGAGYAPLAGVLIADRILRTLEPEEFRHVQTYGGNPVAAAVGSRVLDALESGKLYERVREAEAIYREAFEPLRALDSVFDVRGLGALWGIELAESRAGAPFPREAGVAERVAAACRERGVLVHAGSGVVDGTRGDFVVLAPPLVTEDDSIVEIATALRDSIAQVTGA
ncbi:MAG TPA: aminotransferase class III-fold pyridoxal phosphate-dependent enzyme [Candidatus Eisenbacteria bacterium]|nr:aminotransferase class III-fold pyridoxal phosphate-dependent enzyme [Candidatus Eisenbacteria bacterium]